MSKKTCIKAATPKAFCVKKSSCLFLLCENLSCFSHNDRIHTMIIVCSFSCSQVLFKIKCSIQLETSPILFYIYFFLISPFVSICPLSTLFLIIFSALLHFYLSECVSCLANIQHTYKHFSNNGEQQQ